MKKHVINAEVSVFYTVVNDDGKVVKDSGIKLSAYEADFEELGLEKVIDQAMANADNAQ